VHSGAAAQGLAVAAGATQVLDRSTAPILNLTGDLKNHGIVYVISTNPLANKVIHRNAANTIRRNCANIIRAYVND
jgi:hypothetical protein